MPLIILPKSTHLIPQLCRLLRTGQVIAAPTETAYGLLADALNTKAVARVQKIKGRELSKPIALIAADLPMVRRYFLMARNEWLVARSFWPGPLTLLLKPRHKFPDVMQGSRGLVGVRVPGSAWLRYLVLAADVLLTATSANRAGGVTPYSLSAVRSALVSRGLKYIVDGGQLPRRLTSTVVRLENGRIVVLRRGAISVDRLNAKLENQNAK